MTYSQEQMKKIADAIREKTGSEELIKPIDFAEKINSIHTGLQVATATFTYHEHNEEYGEDKYDDYTSFEFPPIKINDINIIKF